MAKNKGKSKRRRKNWSLRSDAPARAIDAPTGVTKFSERGIKIPSWRKANQDSLVELSRTSGIVTGVFPRSVAVETDNGRLLCGIAQTFRAPADSTALAVGDVVTVALSSPGHVDAENTDMDRTDGMILTRSERRTVLSRPEPRSAKRREPHETEYFSKVIAANADVLLIVTSTAKPRFSRAFIDRALIICEWGRMKPILVINKTDVKPPDSASVDEFRSLGVEVFTCSAAAGDGVIAVVDRLKQTSSILAGQSGVGKSTLINAIIPNADAATREIRSKDNRGRHTTAAAVLYRLDGGGIIIDTPGVRELAIRIEPAELHWYFQEFEPFSGNCKFNNCTHYHEPNCAIIQAVEDGKIPARRYAGYVRILESMED